MALPFLWHMPHETEAHPERVNYFGSIGRKVPMALATSSPLSFLASPSQKTVLLPARKTRPSACSTPLAVLMNCVERSMVMMERGGSYSVRAVIESVMSSRDRIEPPCAVPQLVMNSGLMTMDRRATPF